MFKRCSIEGCQSQHCALTFCDMHYRRWRKYGDPFTTNRHEMSRTQIYKTWCCMKQRCLNPKYHKWKDYGGRGITVCDRWRDFIPFWEDMAATHFEGASIDRIDNNKGYSPENCRWGTAKEQARNRRSTKLITYNSESKIIPEWAACLDIKEHVLYCRLRRGWSVEKALFTPVQASSPTVQA